MKGHTCQACGGKECPTYKLIDSDQLFSLCKTQDRPTSSSREIKLMALAALGVSPSQVLDVELDLSEPAALLKVTYAVPASVNGIITKQIQSYELVSRPGDDG